MKCRQYWFVGCSTGVLFFAWIPSAALACSFVGPDPFTVEQNPDDTTAPGAVSEVSMQIQRGVGPMSDGCDQVMTSCDDLGWLSLRFQAPQDDQNGPEDIGYRLEVVEGTPPGDLGFPSTLIIPQGGVSDGEVSFVFPWLDGASDEQEPFSFVLRITAVDRAGNPSDVSEELVVSDSGSSEGCRSSPGKFAGGSEAWMMLLLGLFWLRRRQARA